MDRTVNYAASMLYVWLAKNIWQARRRQTKFCLISKVRQK